MQLGKKGVKIVASLDELVEQCDAVLIESVDGRVPWKQFRAVAKGKRMFSGKPSPTQFAIPTDATSHGEMLGFGTSGPLEYRQFSSRCVVARHLRSGADVCDHGPRVPESVADRFQIVEPRRRQVERREDRVAAT